MKRFINFFRLFYQEEKGAVLILVALLMVFLLGMTAFAVDIGDMYTVRRNMVNSADAAALAGAKELALGGSEEEAIAVATTFAQNNGADLIRNIDVESRTIDGESFQVVVAEVGRNVEHYFAPVIGITDSDVYGYAVATWGYPTGFGDILPIFYVLEEDEPPLPDGEQLLISSMLAPGNYGFLSLDQSGANELNRVLAGGETSYFDDYDLGTQLDEDDVVAPTQTGSIDAIFHGVEARMELAHSEQDPSIMEGMIPILESIDGVGHHEVVIVGFAPFRIEDIVMGYNRVDNMWYAHGSSIALVEYTPSYNEPPYTAPKYYGQGFPIPPGAHDEYPLHCIIGKFLDDKFISAWDYVGGLSQSDSYNFGTHVVRLVE